MKKILLVDVDSKIPNIALMKISSYYKSQEYNVELKVLNFTYYPQAKNQVIIDAFEYDKVFVSVIFKTNKNVVRVINCNDVYYGGVGTSLTTCLPQEIDVCQKDYSIYPDNDCSYGFITRGCVRNCYFCVVPKKEGNIRKVNDVNNIVRHKKVIFLDNNILAYEKHLDILQELEEKKIKCQFNQGLDIRLLNDKNAKLLSELNYFGEYVFAFDNINDENYVYEKLQLFKKYVNKEWKAKFFLYCHPDMDLFNDVVYRINWCKENKVLPYLMRDISCWKAKYKNFYTDLSAWCNQPSLLKKMTFEQFMQKRTKNVQRRNNSIFLYKNGN